jgi:hypothetical protein
VRKSRCCAVMKDLEGNQIDILLRSNVVCLAVLMISEGTSVPLQHEEY